MSIRYELLICFIPYCVQYSIFLANSRDYFTSQKQNLEHCPPQRLKPGGRGQLSLRGYASARPMIMAIITSLASRPVSFNGRQNKDTTKVFIP